MSTESHNVVLPFRGRRRRVPQSTWVYCPRCGQDLCTSEGTTYTDTDLVRYVCGICGERSSWMFDAPAPLRVMETTDVG